MSVVITFVAAWAILFFCMLANRSKIDKAIENGDGIFNRFGTLIKRLLNSGLIALILALGIGKYFSWF